MDKLKCAVVGTGYFGSFHAEKYASIANCELVGVVDISPASCKKVAQKYNTEAYFNHLDLIGKIDAASIVTATPFHYKIAKELLQQNIHLLIEKPIACSVVEAEELIQLAAAKNLVLQVGHIERFNPIIVSLQDKIAEPEFIEVDRLAPYSPRNKDIDVILDLMIHDLDLILNFVKSEVKDIQAKGIGVWSKIDIANARIVFKNDCVVNITESRFSQKSERKFRIFTKEQYFSIDMKEYTATSYFLNDVKNMQLLPRKYSTQDADPLKAEINHFLDCINKKQSPRVDGVQGKNVLALAQEIKQIIEYGQK